MARARRKDIQIQRDVIEQLRTAARLRLDHIEVRVERGQVVLSGWTASPAKRWAAGEAAHRVPGVVTVLNEILLPQPVASERSEGTPAALTAVLVAAS